MRRAALVLVLAAALAAGCDGGSSDEAAPPPPARHFHSRPDLTPTRVTVTGSDAAAAPGYVFLAPKRDVAQTGPLIVDDTGEPVWFRPLDTEGVADFKVQRYGGRPVLTWWRGHASMQGVGDGWYVIADQSYRQIATVTPGNGLTGDIHEFLIGPDDTAWFTIYRRVARDLTAVGGPRDGEIWEGVVQNLDLRTGRVLFEWHSADHVPLAESYAAHPEPSATSPWDYFHANAIDLEPDGRLLVSARNTHAVYEIARDGRIVWRLGGKRSDFAMGPGTRFAWQHDARRRADGTITIFDNGADPPVEPFSRVIRLRVDTAGHRATLVRSWSHPRRLLAGSQGNAQFLPDGHLFVGWGAIPRFTEYDESGRIVLDARFGRHPDSYRAFRFEWTGRPADNPAVAVEQAEGGGLTVYASWNGSTETRRWQVLAGPDERRLQVLRTVPRSGFETAIPVRTEQPFLRVRALDGGGAVLATSNAVELDGVVAD